ncbi:autotransporter outer membrane beta-barrel domain-containing protein [Escherichia coli]
MQLSGNIFSGRWGTRTASGCLGLLVATAITRATQPLEYDRNCADNQNHGYAVWLTSSWFQHGNQKQGAWLDSWLQYAWFSNNIAKTRRWHKIITTRRGLSPRWRRGISGYRGVVW